MSCKYLERIQKGSNRQKNHNQGKHTNKNTRTHNASKILSHKTYYMNLRCGHSI